MEKGLKLKNFVDFIYGMKIKLKSDGVQRETLMILNPSNNFFLEFIDFKIKLQVKKTIFLPHIKNVRNKFEEWKLKIRIENYTNNIYIVCKNQTKLQYVSQIFTHLISLVKNLHYTIYSRMNRMYYSLDALKLNTSKAKVFSEGDIHNILRTIKIRK